MTLFYKYAYLLSPDTLAGALFYAIAAVLLAWLVGRALQVAIHRYLARAEAAGVDATSVRFLGQLGKGIVYILAFLFYARLIPSLQSLGTTWLASVGVVSVVIALATQSTLSNLVAGIALILYRPFRIGDRLQVMTPNGPEIGVVKSIDLGYTSMRTPDGRRIVLPNSIMTNQTNINFSRTKSHVLLEIPVLFVDSGEIDSVRTIMLEVAQGIAQVGKINGVFVSAINGQGTTLMASLMCLDPGDMATIRSDFLENVKKEFDVKKIRLV